MFNSLHRLRHCRSVVITLRRVMTRSSITHLIVHTSCASRPVSILPPARYHLLPPRIPRLIVRATLSILSPRPPSLRRGIDPRPDNSSILNICTYVSGCPSSTPCSPSSPTPPHPSTARHNTLQQRGTPHRTQRQKTRRRSFSQLPEQLKWPGRVCAEQRRGE